VRLLVTTTNKVTRNTDDKLHVWHSPEQKELPLRVVAKQELPFSFRLKHRHNLVRHIRICSSSFEPDDSLEHQKALGQNRKTFELANIECLLQATETRFEGS
jgi:hypothetical protein